MKQKAKLERLRNQLYMLERGVRAVRANLEEMSMEAAPSSETVVGKRVIPCSLSDMISQCHRLERRMSAPYEELYPGVTVAYPPNQEVVSVCVESRGFADNSGQDDGGSSCLLLRVTRKSTASPGWATLEAEIDPATLATLTDLEVRMILSFQNRNWRSLGSYSVYLRLFFEGEFKDYCVKTFPALDVPIEAGFRISAEDFATLPKLDVLSSKLIIGLPMADEADYTALLSYFEVSGEQQGEAGSPQVEIAGSKGIE